MTISKRLSLRKCSNIEGAFYEDDNNSAWICASFVADWMLGGLPDKLIAFVSDEGHGDMMKIKFDFDNRYWSCGLDRGPMLNRTSKLIEKAFGVKTNLYFKLELI